jgi:hypothetical protein
MLKWILNWLGRCGLDWSGTRYGKLVGCCEFGNETLSAIKLVAFREGFQSMGLVTEIQSYDIGIAFGVMGWLCSVPVTGINISVCHCLQTQSPLHWVPGDFKLSGV